MNVNLLKDNLVSKEIFNEVISLLNSVSGPIQFNIEENLLVEFNENEYFENIQTVEEYKNNLILLPLSNKCTFCGYSLIKINKDDFRCPKCDINLKDERKKIYEKKLNKLTPDQALQTALYKLVSNNKIVAFETLFEKCNNYKQIKNLEKDNFVILLTEMDNFYNWQSSFDEKSFFNGFVKTNDLTWLSIWHSKINLAFPIAFEIISLIIKKYIHNDLENYLDKCHRKPIGCVNDLCFKKEDILLKYRTADICHYCMNNLKQNLPIPTILHALEILEFLRKKMLISNDFMQLSPLSKIVVDNNKNIYLPDFENIKISLNPLEKTLYMLYLFHPEGIEISSICNFKNEMYNIYSHISNRGDIQEMKSKIDRMADVTSNSASEKISKIKEKFVKAIGSELAQYYYIKGANAEAKKIQIDRNLVEIQE
jgi:hypothetical protein